MTDQYSFEAIKRAAGLSYPVPAIEDIVGMPASEATEPQLDHVAEALGHLNAFSWYETAAATAIAAAQVHATLALATQMQRIADALTPEVSDGPF